MKAKVTRDARRHPTAPTVTPPHDQNRLTLPLETLVVGSAGDAGTPRAALLAAAALLLAASGAGGLVVGIFGRRLARTV